MEYCLSFLYIVMEFQSFIWCLDAFVPRRHEDWKFWGLVGICCIVDFGVLNTVRFPSSAFSIGTSIILFFISILFLYKIKNIVFGFVLTILFYAILYFVSFIVYTITASCLGMSIGNLLDNAIEACEAHKAEKQIQVKVLLGTTLYFSIRNTSNPVKIINDSIASTKSNASLHGFGLENVKSILKKYNGDYVMEYTDGWFLFAGEIFNGSIL